MNFLPNVQNVALLAFAAGVSYPRDISKHNNFGFTFEVFADLTADTIFKFQSAPASLADKCVPGVFTDVLEVAICKTPAVGAITQVTLPNGTKAGAICAGTIPCKPNRFVQIVAVSGETVDVRITMVLQGPHGA